MNFIEWTKVNNVHWHRWSELSSQNTRWCKEVVRVPPWLWNAGTKPGHVWGVFQPITEHAETTLWGRLTSSLCWLHCLQIDSQPSRQQVTGETFPFLARLFVLTGMEWVLFFLGGGLRAFQNDTPSPSATWKCAELLKHFCCVVAAALPFLDNSQMLPFRRNSEICLLFCEIPVTTKHCIDLFCCMHRGRGIRQPPHSEIKQSKQLPGT